jgi:hypothetical protein
MEWEFRARNLGQEIGLGFWHGNIMGFEIDCNFWRQGVGKIWDFRVGKRKKGSPG